MNYPFNHYKEGTCMMSTIVDLVYSSLKKLFLVDWLINVVMTYSHMDLYDHYELCLETAPSCNLIITVHMTKKKNECSISWEMRKDFLPILYLSDLTQLITWSTLVWFTFIQSVNAFIQSLLHANDPQIFTYTMASLNK